MSTEVHRIAVKIESADVKVEEIEADRRKRLRCSCLPIKEESELGIELLRVLRVICDISESLLTDIRYECGLMQLEYGRALE